MLVRHSLVREWWIWRERERGKQMKHQQQNRCNSGVFLRVCWRCLHWLALPVLGWAVFFPPFWSLQWDIKMSFQVLNYNSGISSHWLVYFPFLFQDGTEQFFPSWFMTQSIPNAHCCAGVSSWWCKQGKCTKCAMCLLVSSDRVHH